MHYISLVTILLSVTSCFSDDKPQPTPFHDWDYLVYSQRWPITSCTQWEERAPKNTCNMPKDNTTWTVHGVWPTKIGSNGPFFCNSALHFDPSQLQPFMKDLEEYWPNVEANTQPNSFWKHEWNKHGTCASSLPRLNSVTNFFKQGLQWNRDVELATMLEKSNILPGVQGYNISDVYNAVRLATGKNPMVQCVVDADTKNSLISEIRVCFDKDFNLIHCNVTKDLADGDILSNCNGKKSVMYFANVPNNTDFNADFFDDEPDQVGCLDHFIFQAQLIRVYTAIKFLMWFTL